MDTDFEQVVKYLDIQLVEVDRTLNTKPLTFSLVRRIKKLQEVLVLSEFSEAVTPYPYYKLRWQYNCSLPRDFSILNISPNIQFLTPHCIVFAYRVDDVKIRYLIDVQHFYSQTNSNKVLPRRWIPYNGQLIKKDFTIEVWTTDLADTVQIASDYTFFLSRFRNPTSPDEVDTYADIQSTLVKNELFHALPEPIPTPYGEVSAWKNNA